MGVLPGNDVHLWRQCSRRVEAWRELFTPSRVWSIPAAVLEFNSSAPYKSGNTQPSGLVTATAFAFG